MGLLELGMLSLMGIMFSFLSGYGLIAMRPTSVAPTLWNIEIKSHYSTTLHKSNADTNNWWALPN